MTPELEIILAEGAGIQPGYSSQKLLDKCKRCKLSQISIAGIDLFTKKNYNEENNVAYCNVLYFCY